MRRSILGISAYYHDSAAALLIDGTIRYAAQEERFTRVKHDASFPANAVRFVLDESGMDYSGLEAVVFYEKPYIKFERLLETYHAFAPRGLVSFISAMPVWMKEKLFIKREIRKELSVFGRKHPPILFPEHHLSHAASAFFPSPFPEAAILTVDGVGEWATSTICHGRGNSISILRELDFPHSLGLLYSAFTYYCGFKVNSGEYKLMGLAPFGIASSAQTMRWKRLILEELVDIREDGSFLLNMDYFTFATGLRMCDDDTWAQLFGIPRRMPESELTQSCANMALAIQQVTEEIMLRLARTAKELTGARYLVMSGGVALNCVANGKLIESNLFEDIWVQPAAGDAGGALGAAYAAWHIHKGEERRVAPGCDAMRGALLGPEYDDRDIVKVAEKYEAPFERYEDFDLLTGHIAGLLDDGYIVGWFQGRMEFGPRALGNRSILGDPRNPEMQRKLNLKIKFRESFRPFAPSVLLEDCGDYFELDKPSPYMLFVAAVKERRRRPVSEADTDEGLTGRLNRLRSDIPAVTHIDYSARIQTVSGEENPRFRKLIEAFRERTGCGLVVNTSFNVRGEPIVCTPADAYRCFMRTRMDYLVMGNFVFDKKLQPVWDEPDEIDPD